MIDNHRDTRMSCCEPSKDGQFPEFWPKSNLPGQAALTEDAIAGLPLFVQIFWEGGTDSFKVRRSIKVGRNNRIHRLSPQLEVDRSNNTVYQSRLCLALGKFRFADATHAHRAVLSVLHSALKIHCLHDIVPAFGNICSKLLCVINLLLHHVWIPIEINARIGAGHVWLAPVPEVMVLHHRTKCLVSSVDAPSTGGMTGPTV